VIRYGLQLLALSVPIGLLLAYALARSMSSLLFGVTQAAIFVVSAGVLAAATLAAVSWPVYRATRVDPAGSLRAL
jgi:ABC-type antimicrobial peptide transport system permease subunit